MHRISSGTDLKTHHVLQARAEGGGGGGGPWGLQPLPFFKIIQKCPSRTNSNDIVVNKTKYIWILINMTMCTKQKLIAQKCENSCLFLHICQSEALLRVACVLLYDHWSIIENWIAHDVMKVKPPRRHIGIPLCSDAFHWIKRKSYEFNEKTSPNKSAF